MSQLINEAKRFQKLAGMLVEAEEVSAEMSPEEAAKKASNLSGEIEKNPKVQQAIDKINQDPKAKEELKKLISTYHISLNEGDSGIQSIALAFAKKAETLEEDYGGSFLTGLIGGGTLAHYLFSVTTPDFVGGLTHSTAAMPETLAGAVIGAILAVVARKIYGKAKGIDESQLNEERIMDFNEWLNQIAASWPSAAKDLEILGVDINTISPEEFISTVKQEGEDNPNYVSISFGKTIKVDRKSDFISFNNGLQSFGHYSPGMGGLVTEPGTDFSANVYPPGSRMDEKINIEKTVNEALKKFRKNK